jgi:hypothetical protein
MPAILLDFACAFVLCRCRTACCLPIYMISLVGRLVVRRCMAPLASRIANCALVCVCVCVCVWYDIYVSAPDISVAMYI